MDVVERVEWWLNDMAFKAPEQLTNWYYFCMARDIMQVATDSLDFKWSGQRLDPPDTTWMLRYHG